MQQNNAHTSDSTCSNHCTCSYRCTCRTYSISSCHRACRRRSLHPRHYMQHMQQHCTCRSCSVPSCHSARRRPAWMQKAWQTAERLTTPWLLPLQSRSCSNDNACSSYSSHGACRRPGSRKHGTAVRLTEQGPPLLLLLQWRSCQLLWGRTPAQSCQPGTSALPSSGSHPEETGTCPQSLPRSSCCWQTG